MLLAPLVYDGGLQRRFTLGDTLAGSEQPIPATDLTNTTLVYTPAMLVNSTVYVRNPAGVSTDTFPSADILIAALSGGLGSIGITPGLSFRWRVINLSANLLTGAVNANTGATMIRGNVLASTTKDFLIQITNGTPLLSATNITTVNASAVTTGWTTAQLAAISVGQIVTNAVANLQGTTIISINIVAGSVTFSGTANASAAGNTITVSPTYTITGLAA